MVPKIAVIALVFIVASPILLGFAMNLTEVTETEYITDGESTNVTQLLMNGGVYSMTHGNAYQMNSDFSIIGNSNPIEKYPIYPTYNSITSTSSSFPMYYDSNDVLLNPSYSISMADFNWFYTTADYDPSLHSLYIVLYELVGGVETPTALFADFSSFYYDASSSTSYIREFDDADHYDLSEYTYTGILTKIEYTTDSPFTATINQWGLKDNTNTYIDISAGFYFENIPNNWSIEFPDYTRSVLVTINLDSITDSNYRIVMNTVPLINAYILEKTTVDAIVYWKIKNPDNSVVFDLYYDPSRNDNTYQMYLEFTKDSEDSTYKYYSQHLEMRYIGGWPTVLGPANYYLKYTEDKTISTALITPDLNLDNVLFYTLDNSVQRTPTIRIDDAYFNGFQYPVIENEVYNPATFKNNPITTVKDLRAFGTSLSFGGNTYTVDSNGDIMLGTHKTSVNKITFSSVPTISGYDNKINGITVSTTAEPSTITFTGKWLASVLTDSQSTTTVTKTEWTPGHFAWDGLDTNFLIAAIMTAFAVFVCVGIYAKTRRVSIIPAVVVCGCAAILFFLMI